MNGKEFRIWNQQLISYAGYTNRLENENDLNNGPTEHKSAIIGDPINVEFTQVRIELNFNYLNQLLKKNNSSLNFYQPNKFKQIIPGFKSVCVCVCLEHSWAIFL